MIQINTEQVIINDHSVNRVNQKQELEEIIKILKGNRSDKIANVGFILEGVIKEITYE